MSSITVAKNILAISQQYTIYVSFLILFAGVFGHAANIFVITRLKLFRNNPSALYLITESLFNLLQMLVPFTSRIAINGFGDDLSRTSLFWCKFRMCLTQTVTLSSLSIVCFASIDQFLSTSHYPYLRQKSTVKLAKILIIIASVLWTVHWIPLIIFLEIRPTGGCNVYNYGLVMYTTYAYYLTLSGLLPIVVSTFFGLLAYQNVRRIIRRQMAIRRRKLDRQLTAMILARVAFLVIACTPYVAQRIYSLTILPSIVDPVHQAAAQLVGAITISFFYLNYSVKMFIVRIE